MNSVIKGVSYILAHTPDMVINNGTTQTSERVVNPDSEYLKVLKDHLRSYEDVVGYYPNQCYIGGITPTELKAIEGPWYEKKMEGASRYGKFGEIMPQDEFILLMQACDVFDLVKLDSGFVSEIKPKLEKHELMSDEILAKVKDGVELSEIEKLIAGEGAEGIYNDDVLVGCVKRAHDIDVSLSAHTIYENLVSKASCVLSVLHLLKNTDETGEDIQYIIECSEEACGDMNQRGGGNFAKAVGEMAGLKNATGSDVRGFCAGPTHALIQAASLVKAGTFDKVIVAAGGSTAKLGMNGKDHVKKGMPILEDIVGGFAVLVTKNDGINPEINLDILGRHTVDTGSAPQAVISSLTSEPLTKAGRKITDIDKYAVEMQNPEVTKPAGAGDVPMSNYKMIGALAVKLGQIERTELNDFIDKHGMVGWAPTQGHIPSGVPCLGFAREDILSGKMDNLMLIGKGSLFLGRMTNLFDGVSFLVEKNTGVEEKSNISEEEIKSYIANAMKDFAQSLLKED